jgi:hypothetical protein
MASRSLWIAVLHLIVIMMFPFVDVDAQDFEEYCICSCSSFNSNDRKL